MHETTPEVLHDDRPALWIFPDGRDSRSHPVEEVLSKADNLQFIIDNSVNISCSAGFTMRSAFFTTVPGRLGSRQQQIAQRGDHPCRPDTAALPPRPRGVHSRRCQENRGYR
jgi:hypothetical protein